jgi:hypothetical membrane protein
MAIATTRTMNRATTSLLLCGAIAGPFYIVVAVIQLLIRDGFDLRRHALSLLGNGELGWMQIGNFVISGGLVLAGAIGMRRALHPGRGETWVPVLIGIYGASLIAAGIFIADPSFGFPPGTPEGPPAAISLHGILHFVAGAIGFLSLIVGCFVLARRFAAMDHRGWAVFSRITGTAFFLAFAGIASGGGAAIFNEIFATAIVLVWVWLSAVCAHLIAQSSPDD